ncbi:MAG: DUF4190 domain-containing protein [Acidobacteriota bacterium]
MTPHRGTLIIVLGILSLTLCPPIGIGAWIMGTKDLAEIDAGRMDPAGREFARIGRILGIIATIYFALWVFAVVAFVIFRLIPFLESPR